MENKKYLLGFLIFCAIGLMWTVISFREQLHQNIARIYTNGINSSPAKNLSKKYDEEQYFADTKEFDSSREQPFFADTKDFVSSTEQPVCSDKSFREYYRAHHAFPEKGQWVRSTNNPTLWYQPDFCRFLPTNFPICYKHKNIKHIVMTGDSTAGRLFASLINVTIAAGGTCMPLRVEGPTDWSLQPNKSYYSQALNSTDIQLAIQTSTRPCGYCQAQKYICKLRTNDDDFYEVALEMISNSLFSDYSISIPENMAKKYNLPPAKNTMEFIFQTFFPTLGHPDIVIMNMPLNHQKKKPWDQGSQDFKSLLDVIIKNKGEKTKVYWIPTAAECERKKIGKGLKYQNMLYGEKHPSLATDRIYAINSHTYKILEPYLLDQTSNIYGFVNLVNMSQTKCDWNLDGIHYDPLWYSILQRTIMTTICG